MSGVPATAVSSGRSSIHPDTQGTPLHPDRQGWKTNRGNMGTRGKAMYGHWEPYRQAICHDVEAHLPVPPLGPSTSDWIPFKPHCTLLQYLASRPSRHLPHSFASSLSPLFPSRVSPRCPGSMYPSHHHMIPSEVKYKDGSHRKELDVEMSLNLGVKCNFRFPRSSADLKEAPTWIRLLCSGDS